MPRATMDPKFEVHECLYQKFRIWLDKCPISDSGALQNPKCDILGSCKFILSTLLMVYY